jgi:hypothetical protein
MRHVTIAILLAACGSNPSPVAQPTRPPPAIAQVPAPKATILTITDLNFYMADKLSLKLHADGRVEVDNGEGWHPVGTLTAEGKVIHDGGDVLGALLPSGEFQTAEGKIAAFRLDGVELVVKNGDRFSIDAQGKIGGARDYQIRVEGLTDAGSKRAALFLMALMRGNHPY